MAAHPVSIDELDLQRIPPAGRGSFWLQVVSNGLGEPVRLPLMILRGRQPGPVLGVTAALHGNELNGIPVIQQLMQEIDAEQLRGAIVGVLVMNVPGLLLDQRKFNDGADLNRIAPGRPDGSVSQVYINRIVERLLSQFDYLIDLHTASFGRINSWYIRADMGAELTSRMARLQNPDIILHNPANDGTFRGVAASRGIPAITLELRDPHVFQFDVIADALVGLRNVLFEMGFYPGTVQGASATTLLCDDSYWLYTDEGGILRVFPEVGCRVVKDQLIAEVRSVYGSVRRRYYAPENGMVIGKSVHPVSPTGSRILHLGLRPRAIPCG